MQTRFWALLFVIALPACGPRDASEEPNEPSSSSAGPELTIDAHRAATQAAEASLTAIAARVRDEPAVEAPSLDGLSEPLRLAHGAEPHPNAALLDETDLENIENPDADVRCRFRYETPFEVPIRNVRRGYTASIFNDLERRLLERSFRELEAIKYVVVCRTREYRVPALADGAVVQGRHRGDILVYHLARRTLVGSFPFDIETSLSADELRRKQAWFRGDRIDLGNAVFESIWRGLGIQSPPGRSD